MMTKKDKKNHWDFLTQLLGSEDTPDTLENVPEVCEEGDIQEKTPESLTMEETSSCQEERETEGDSSPEEVFCFTKSSAFTEWQEEKQTTEDAELEENAVFPQPSLVVEEIEEEGYVFKKIQTVQRPRGGFGAGILEELFPEETFEEMESEEETPDPEMENAKEPAPEQKLSVPVEALDPWAMLAMDLGLPVTLPPEKKSEKKMPEKKPVPVQEVVEPLTQEIEKEDSGMEKRDRQQTTSRSRGKKSFRKEKETEEMELTKAPVAKPREKRRKERVERETLEKVVSSDEKRRGKKSRIQETPSEDVDYPTDIPGYESEEAMQRMRELFPAPMMDQVEVEEIPEEEERYPNAARSRRRRRSKREHEESFTEAVAEIPEEEETARPPRSRRRKERNWETRPRRDELPMEEEDWSEYSEEEDDEKEVLSVPKRRRNRRESPSYEQEDRMVVSEDDSYEEDHVFEEIEEPIEEEEDTDEINFATLNVPGWRDTINIIVNTNLSARNREPSSMAGNLKAKRRPRRRT